MGTGTMGTPANPETLIENESVVTEQQPEEERELDEVTQNTVAEVDVEETTEGRRSPYILRNRN